MALEIIEVQSGPYLGEDDIVRFDDVYGRTATDPARSGAPVVRQQPLPMPSGAEIRLARARRLYAQGELHAALALLEAKLAVPYAFAELGAFGQALDGYKQAIAVFERENNDLDESIAAIRAGKLLNGLLERNPGEEMGWFWNITELPEMPHGGYKESGHGKDMSVYSIEEYTNVKHVMASLE